MPARKSPTPAPPVKKPSPRPSRKTEEKPTEAPVETDAPPKGFTFTDNPGVFRNRAGVLVNAYGVAVTFAQLKAQDKQRTQEALDGRLAETPADYLDSVWRDPRMPSQVRIDAAKSSAPYRNQKLIGLSGVVGGVPIALNYSGDSDEDLERKQKLIEDVLTKLGVAF